MIDLAPIPQVHYTCTKCEVGWSSAIGDICWCCNEKSMLMSPIIIWYMTSNSQPAWRVGADRHTTGEPS